MRKRAPWWLGLVVLATSGSAAAANRVVILPADASGGTSKDVLRTVNAALAGLADAVTGVETLAGPALKKKLRVEARACGEDPACLAKVGRHAKVDEVVTVRARTHGNGLRLTFLVIGVENHRLLRTVSVNVDSIDGVAAGVRIRLAKILGVKQADLYAEKVTDEPVDELELTAMPSLAPLPGADEMKPVEKTAVETVEAAPVEEHEVAAVEPVGPTTPPDRDPGSSWMWYSGWGLVGAGAILGGVATFFGTRYLSKKNAIDEDGPYSTPQKPAVRLEEEANSARTSGIILGAVAGAVGAAGAGLLIADVVSDDVAVNVTVQPGAAQASIGFTW